MVEDSWFFIMTEGNWILTVRSSVINFWTWLQFLEIFISSILKVYWLISAFVVLLRIRYHCKLLGCILSLVIVDLVDRWVSWFLSLHIEESFPRKILVLIFSIIISHYRIIDSSTIGVIILYSYHILAIGEVCLSAAPQN